MEITVKHVISVSPETQEFFTALVSSIFSAKPAAPVAEVPKTRKKQEDPKLIDITAPCAGKSTAEPADFKVSQKTIDEVKAAEDAMNAEEDPMMGRSIAPELTGEELFAFCMPYLKDDKLAPDMRALFLSFKKGNGIDEKTIVTKMPDGKRQAFKDLVLKQLPTPQPKA